MSGTALFWLVLSLGLGLGIVIYLIAGDTKRFLTRFELSEWRESYYLRALPNFLQALHNHNFKSPWPARPDAVAVAYFCYRARPLLKRRSPSLRKAFLRQHILLFALMEILRPYFNDFFLSEEQRIVTARVADMEDTLDRDRLIAFLESARRHRAQFYRTLTDYDRQILAAIIDRNLMGVLKRTHAIFQEHGFSLMPEFTQLRRWDEMNGVELVQELPVLPVLRTADLPSQQPARR